MAEQRSIVAVLREADEAYRKLSPTHGTDARILGRLEGGARQVMPRWALGVLASATIALFVGWLAWRSGSAPSDSRLVSNGFVGEQGCFVEAGGSSRSVEMRRSCSLTPSAEPRVRMHAAAGAVFRAASRGVEFLRGHAEFEVEAAPPGRPPVEVLVSAGTISVVGTRFAVDESQQGGSVRLLSGHITFTDRRHVTTKLAPGEKYAWGPEVPQVTATAPSSRLDARPVASGAPLPEPSASAEIRETTRDTEARRRATASLSKRELEELDELRRSGRYAQARTLLTELVARAKAPREAELLGYELGDVMAHVASRAEVCGYWSRYLERFPRGRYAAIVAKTRARLECDAP